MNLGALMVAFSYLQAARGPKDVYVKTADVKTLAEGLKHDYPNLDLEVFKQNGIYRVGTTGMYLSNALRNYIFNGNVNPKEKGAIITIIFQTPESASEVADDDKHMSRIVYLIRQAGLEEKDVYPLLKRYSETHK